jgi:drug/metabolite transporter (DMT)-like permease
MIKPARWFWNSAAALLTGATALWAANAAASRVAVGEVSPMFLTSSRWLLISALMAAAMSKAIRPHIAEMWSRRWLVLALATFGLTGFNAATYIAAHYTTAVNMALLQCIIPALVLAGSAATGGRVTAKQWLGVAITTIGVVAVATRGAFGDILLLRLNLGDALMLAACAGGAWYNLKLARRPKIPAAVFFAGLAVASYCVSLPLVAIEAAAGAFQWPTWKGWAVVVFAALGPALLAQVFFLRAVDLVGPGRAGVYNNLVPVFGAFFGVFLLGEPFAWYHALGLALALGGIWVSERGKAAFARKPA